MNDKSFDIQKFQSLNSLYEVSMAKLVDDLLY